MGSAVVDKVGVVAEEEGESMLSAGIRSGDASFARRSASAEANAGAGCDCGERGAGSDDAAGKDDVSWPCKSCFN